MLDYDLQVLGIYIKNTELLKFLAYTFSTILFLYLGKKISKNNKEEKKEKTDNKEKTKKKDKKNKKVKNGK